jgi:hypothetical protein
MAELNLKGSILSPNNIGEDDIANSSESVGGMSAGPFARMTMKNQGP